MRYVQRYLKFIIIVIATQLCISCAAKYYRVYEAEPKAGKDVALLVGIQKWASFKNEDAIVRIVSIDNKTGFSGSWWDGEYEIELLPGVHEIQVRYNAYGFRSTTPMALSFNFEPGQIYMVKPNLSQTYKHWAPSIVNITDKMTK